MTEPTRSPLHPSGDARLRRHQDDAAGGEDSSPFENVPDERQMETAKEQQQPRSDPEPSQPQP